MFEPIKLFENFLNDSDITPTRLVAFGHDHINKMESQNGGGKYTALIALVAPLIDTLQGELGDIDVAVTVQKGKTATVDTVIKDFKKAMSDKEGVIADALGGRTSPEYLQFYPKGITEYSIATKTELPTLLNRVKVAATANDIALGVTLSTLLKGFEQLYTDARTEQQTQIGTVDSNRSERETAYIAAQLGLVESIHTIGGFFPGNAIQCMSLFDFNLLYATTHQTNVTKSGSIDIAGISQILNQTLTDSMKLNVKNTDENASFIIYLAPTAGAEPNGTGVEVKPKKGKNIVPSSLGSLNNTYLLIKNLSVVNEGSYIVVLKS